MKMAILKICSVDVICPHCNEVMEEPSSGSLMWEIGHPDLAPGNTVECRNCGEAFEMPSAVKGEKL